MTHTRKSYDRIASAYARFDTPAAKTILRALKEIRAGRCCDPRVVLGLEDVEKLLATGKKPPAESGQALEAAEEFVRAAYTFYVLREIRKALGRSAATQKNPCGGCGYYDAEESRPYRVLFSDQAGCESYRTLKVAVAAAKKWATSP